MRKIVVKAAIGIVLPFCLGVHRLCRRGLGADRSSNEIYMDLPGGIVIIELHPEAAPLAC